MIFDRKASPRTFELYSSSSSGGAAAADLRHDSAGSYQPQHHYDEKMSDRGVGGAGGGPASSPRNAGSAPVGGGSKFRSFLFPISKKKRSNPSDAPDSPVRATAALPAPASLGILQAGGASYGSYPSSSPSPYPSQASAYGYSSRQAPPSKQHQQPASYERAPTDPRGFYSVRVYDDHEGKKAGAAAAASAGDLAEIDRPYSTYSTYTDDEADGPGGYDDYEEEEEEEEDEEEDRREEEDYDEGYARGYGPPGAAGADDYEEEDMLRSAARSSSGAAGPMSGHPNQRERRFSSGRRDRSASSGRDGPHGGGAQGVVLPGIQQLLRHSIETEAAAVVAAQAQQQRQQQQQQQQQQQRYAPRSGASSRMSSASGHSYSGLEDYGQAAPGPASIGAIAGNPVEPAGEVGGSGFGAGSSAASAAVARRGLRGQQYPPSARMHHNFAFPRARDSLPIAQPPPPPPSAAQNASPAPLNIANAPGGGAYRSNSANTSTDSIVPGPASRFSSVESISAPGAGSGPSRLNSESPQFPHVPLPPNAFLSGPTTGGTYRSPQVSLGRRRSGEDGRAAPAPRRLALRSLRHPAICAGGSSRTRASACGTLLVWPWQQT